MFLLIHKPRCSTEDQFKMITMKNRKPRSACGYNLLETEHQEPMTMESFHTDFAFWQAIIYPKKRLNHSKRSMRTGTEKQDSQGHGPEQQANQRRIRALHLLVYYAISNHRSITLSREVPPAPSLCMGKAVLFLRISFSYVAKQPIYLLLCYRANIFAIRFV